MSKLVTLLLMLCGPMLAQAINHSVTLTWTYTQGTVPATGFAVKRSTVQAACTLVPQPMTCVTQTNTSLTNLTYVDTVGLVEGTKYYYTVTATAAGGVESLPSGEASATVPFPPPVPNAPSTPTLVVK